MPRRCQWFYIAQAVYILMFETHLGPIGLEHYVMSVCIAKPNIVYAIYGSKQEQHKTIAPVHRSLNNNNRKRRRVDSSRLHKFIFPMSMPIKVTHIHHKTFAAWLLCDFLSLSPSFHCHTLSLHFFNTCTNTHCLFSIILSIY